MAEKPRENGPEWQASDHSPYGDRSSRRRGLLSQRGHDVFLFPGTYAWVMPGVVINHSEPQQAADTADATEDVEDERPAQGLGDESPDTEDDEGPKRCP